MKTSAKVSDIQLLRTVLGNSPSPKIGSDLSKFISCTQALKKALKKHVDELEKLSNTLNEVRKPYQEKADPILVKLRQERDDEAKSLFQKELDKVTDLIKNDPKVTEANEALQAYNKKLETEKGTVEFDHEAFNFLKKFMDENGAELCQLKDNEGKPVGVDIPSLERIDDLIKGVKDE